LLRFERLLEFLVVTLWLKELLLSLYELLYAYIVAYIFRKIYYLHGFRKRASGLLQTAEKEQKEDQIKTKTTRNAQKPHPDDKIIHSIPVQNEIQ